MGYGGGVRGSPKPLRFGAAASRRYSEDVTRARPNRSQSCSDEFCKMKPILALIVLVCLTITGCVSHYPANRTARLRQIYPPGMPRQEVQTKWGQIKPEFSAVRPPDGWEAYQDQYISKKLKNVEVTSGKKVDSVDRYWGPDGWLSLCYCWYFYGSDEKIVDVEWQYKSD